MNKWSLGLFSCECALNRIFIDMQARKLSPEFVLSECIEFGVKEDIRVWCLCTGSICDIILPDKSHWFIPVVLSLLNKTEQIYTSPVTLQKRFMLAPIVGHF